MKGKVTVELLEKMKTDRKSGLTYREIEGKYGVGRWTTLHYLKGIEPIKSLASELWKGAEKKAEEYLARQGFQHIIKLNEICPQGHFDFYAEKKSDKWLIDATINENKDLIAKSLRVVKGFRCAVLYVSHDFKKFTFAELKILLEK